MAGSCPLVDEMRRVHVYSSWSALAVTLGERDQGPHRRTISVLSLEVICLRVHFILHFHRGHISRSEKWLLMQ